MSKPFGVCWCDCHIPLDADGRRDFAVVTDENHVNGWPRLDYAVAVAVACDRCKADHASFIATGIDYHHGRAS